MKSLILSSCMAIALLVGIKPMSGQGVYIEDGATLFLQAGSSWTPSGIINTEVHGTIAGFGTYKSNNVNVETTGKISPGSSIGTLTIQGDLNLQDGTLVVEVDDATTHDKVMVTGFATIVNNDSKLDITFNYNPTQGSTYDVITSPFTQGNFISANINITGGSVSEVTGGGTLAISALPVELTDFSAIKTGDEVHLQWATASETDNAGFEVQKATDDNLRQWETLGFVIGNGTALTGQEYSFVDEYPAIGTNYYRLKQVDFNGEHDFSPTVSVEFDNKLGLFHLYPNPTDGAVFLSLETDFTGAASLQLFAPTGQLMEREALHLDGQFFSTQFDFTHLPNGVYIVEVVAGKQRWNQRIVLK